jgi:hypothetical protein
MDRELLRKTIKHLLDTEDELSFLDKLTDRELERLIVCIRDRIDRSLIRKSGGQRG